MTSLTCLSSTTWSETQVWKLHLSCQRGQLHDYWATPHQQLTDLACIPADRADADTRAVSLAATCLRSLGQDTWSTVQNSVAQKRYPCVGSSVHR